MAYHDFCIMQNAPKPGVRFDKYKPDEFGKRVRIDDDLIEPFWATYSPLSLDTVNTYCHTVDIKYNGLVYTGITLIPPESFDELRSILEPLNGFSDLIELIAEAKSENKFIIHFGI